MTNVVSDSLIAAAQLTALADAAEAATGPSEQLDMYVDCAIKGIEVAPLPTEFNDNPGYDGQARIESTDYKLLGHLWRDGRFAPYGSYPAVTASIDEANKLLPDNVIVAVTVSADGSTTCALTLNEVEKYVTATAATEPLARTAAALLAHAALVDQGGAA